MDEWGEGRKVDGGMEVFGSHPSLTPMHSSLSRAGLLTSIPYPHALISLPRRSAHIHPLPPCTLALLHPRTLARTHARQREAHREVLDEVRDLAGPGALTRVGPLHQVGGAARQDAADDLARSGAGRRQLEQALVSGVFRRDLRERGVGEVVRERESERGGACERWCERGVV
jgi:hypothetical protein